MCYFIHKKLANEDIFSLDERPLDSQERFLYRESVVFGVQVEGSKTNVSPIHTQQHAFHNNSFLWDDVTSLILDISFSAAVGGAETWNTPTIMVTRNAKTNPKITLLRK
jgi:hypothetical protein